MGLFDIDAEFEAAKKRAFRVLERMPRTSKQLEDKLLKDEKYSEEKIKLVIEYMKSYRYIDDRQYAYDYINGRKNSKGIKVLLYELKNKGIPEDILEEMKEEFSDYDSSEAIKKLIIKKGIDPNSEDRKQREKLYRFLLSRGFNYSEISRAVSDLSEEM